MICYFCGTTCYNDSTCPGVCPAPDCNTKAANPELWKDFLAAKQQHIVEAMRPGTGTPYIHLTPKEQP